MKRPCIAIASAHPRHDGLERAIAARIAGFEVIRIRSRVELTQAVASDDRPEMIFFPHWSWKIPRRVHERVPCVIFHMTDLPFGRGGSPLQNLVLLGHSATVLTALHCVEQVDAGPVYLKRPLDLAGSAQEILERAAQVMEDMIVEILGTRPQPMPQVGEPTEFARRRPDQSSLEGLATSAQVYDFIRMLDAEGYPNAFVETPNLRLEFTDAQLSGEWVHAKVRIKVK